MNIIHVRHEFLSEDAPFFISNSNGAKIHENSSSKKGEYQVLKNTVNSFKNNRFKRTP